jgi:hypothetical protein
MLNYYPLVSKPRVDIAWPATFRCVAGDVEKLALLMTVGTDIRGFYCSNGILTIPALPVSQAALGTDIPNKFP